MTDTITITTKARHLVKGDVVRPTKGGTKDMGGDAYTGTVRYITTPEGDEEGAGHKLVRIHYRQADADTALVAENRPLIVDRPLSAAHQPPAYHLGMSLIASARVSGLLSVVLYAGPEQAVTWVFNHETGGHSSGRYHAADSFTHYTRAAFDDFVKRSAGEFDLF